MQNIPDTRLPVLILGGYGNLGTRLARMLRQLHPTLPITIAGRDIRKAATLADEIGHAAVAGIALHKADLGLPDDVRYSVVVTALRDHSLNTLRYAQRHATPYIALSDAAFEIGPLVARYVHNPTRSPILMLGHSMGAVPALSALHFSREFSTVESIAIGLVFDPADPFGPASATDMERIEKTGPSPLLLRDGRWRWVGAEEAARRFTGVDGFEHQGQAVGLVDVLSLGSAARAIRVDFAEGITASRRRGEAASHEVIIEVTGARIDGTTGCFRYEIVDPQGYAAMSARGVAVAVETLIGLTETKPPPPGLYLPEELVNTSHLMRRLGEFGVRVDHC